RLMKALDRTVRKVRSGKYAPARGSKIRQTIYQLLRKVGGIDKARLLTAAQRRILRRLPTKNNAKLGRELGVERERVRQILLEVIRLLEIQLLWNQYKQRPSTFRRNPI